MLIESAHNGFKLDLSGILQGTRSCTWHRQRVEPYTMYFVRGEGQTLDRVGRREELRGLTTAIIVTPAGKEVEERILSKL